MNKTELHLIVFLHNLLLLELFFWRLTCTLKIEGADVRVVFFLATVPEHVFFVSLRGGGRKVCHFCCIV